MSERQSALCVVTSEGYGEMARHPKNTVRCKVRLAALQGLTSARRVISMRPAAAPPMVMSKKTTGLDIVVGGVGSGKVEKVASC